MAVIRDGEGRARLRVRRPRSRLSTTQALAAGLPVFLVADAGRTVIPSGTVTCLGIGPAPDQVIAPVTGALKLLR